VANLATSHAAIELVHAVFKAPIQGTTLVCCRHTEA